MMAIGFILAIVFTILTIVAGVISVWCSNTTRYTGSIVANVVMIILLVAVAAIPFILAM